MVAKLTIEEQNNFIGFLQASHNGCVFYRSCLAGHTRGDPVNTECGSSLNLTFLLHEHVVSMSHKPTMPVRKTFKRGRTGRVLDPDSARGPTHHARVVELSLIGVGSRIQAMGEGDGRDAGKKLLGFSGKQTCNTTRRSQIRPLCILFFNLRGPVLQPVSKHFIVLDARIAK